jgi:hypothetical protein
MEDFKFKGKTIEEWEKELDEANGFDEKGNPEWWNAQANLEDATVFKKLMEEGLKKYVSLRQK